MRLGELISPAKVERCGSRELPVLSMTMHGGIVLQADRFKKAIASKDQSTYKVVKPGQLVVGFPIDEGVLYVQGYPYEGIMSPAYNVWDIDSGTVDPQYLELALHSPQSMSFYRNKMRGTTARRRSLPASTLVELDVPVPPKKRQFEITTTLIGIRSETKELVRMGNKLDELVKSRFVEMFGDPETNPMEWEMHSIGELATDVRYGTSKPASVDGEYTYIRMNNMTYEGGLDLTDTKRITLDDKELDKALVHYGDLLFNRTNSRDKVGKTCVFKLDEPMVIAGYIIRVRLCDDIEPEYLSTYLNTSHAKRLLREMAHGAVNQANINAKEMQSIVVPVPPIELQREFLAFVAQVDKLKFETQQAIDKLQMLYDSLAQEYFSGA